MMRLIEQRTATGEVFERGRLRGTIHYTLNVYQQYDEGQDDAVTGVTPGAGAAELELRAAQTDGR
jgi:hypothetical protein